MKKQRFVFIIIILLLSGLLIGCGVSTEEYTKVVNDYTAIKIELESVRTELEAKQAELEALQPELKSIKAELEKDQAELENLKESSQTLENDLQVANDEIDKLEGDIKAQQQINSSLSDELEKITYPRHFQSLTELTDWLRQDDTNTKYASEEYRNMCYILQVKALRDGYILPVSIDYEEYEDILYYSNVAIIEDELYWVWPDDDYTEFAYYITPLPSRPIAFD